MPVIDVALSKLPYPPTAAQKACVAKLQSQGLKPAKYNDFMTAYQACDGIELYAASLAKAGTTAAQAIATAAVALLPKFQAAGTYAGRLAASGKQRGGPGVLREIHYDTGCGCMTYVGPTYPVPLP